jgi:putative Holliday junction resolvase
MNILCLDIGFSRVGLAVGNTSLKIAFPREIINFKNYLSVIKNIIKLEDINMVLIGDPKLMSNEDSPHRSKIFEEKSKIEKYCNIKVSLFDERFTSKIAENSLHEMGYSMKNQKNKKDNIAACIILQGWLDKSDNLIS